MSKKNQTGRYKMTKLMRQYNEIEDKNLLAQMKRLEQIALSFKRPLNLDSLRVLNTYWKGLEKNPIKFDDPGKFQPSWGAFLKSNWCTACGWVSELSDESADIPLAMYCKKYGKVVAYIDECPAGKWKRSEFAGPSMWRA